MAKKLLWVIALTVIFIAANASAELSKTMPEVNLPRLTGEEELNISDAIPYTPGAVAESPGDIVGYTYYDYQTNGSSGNRVCLYENGNKYFAFMKLFGWPYPPAPRHVYHNWVDSDGAFYFNDEGSQVSENSGAGYTNMDIYDGNRAAIFYHNGDYDYVSIEDEPLGLGFFTQYQIPNQLYPQTPESPGICSWPYGTVDNQNFIHVVASENTDRRIQRVGYTRSEDGGSTWSNFVLVDTAQVIGSIMASSPVSNRVVLAYPKTQDTTTQWNNDICYYVSDDGTTWNWRYGRNNVTNYGTDNDSLWAYTDLDVLIDYNDDIQLLWNAQWVTDEGIYYKTFMEHWSEATDQITTIQDFPDSLWGDISGAWNRSMCKMSLGTRESDNALFATWTQFDTSDVSTGGFANGEIYATGSRDGGLNWADPINITNSHTPDCFPGECDSDHWSSLAEVVDENIHVFYTNDKDAGGIPQEEGSATENPMRYMTYSADALLTTGIDEETNLPTSFALNQNYPNPFNATTTISFNLNVASNVTIDIYDITGAKVTTLMNEDLAAGEHHVNWDASDVASGVYYYKLTADGISETKQAVLIK